jgi:polyisoprenoid-binding protein YceI
MLGVERHPEITFRSKGAESNGFGSWVVHGNLTVRGETRPVAVEVREAGDHYVGSSRFKQTEFGITPVKVAGGAIRVKDEIAIEFNIHLAR